MQRVGDGVLGRRAGVMATAHCIITVPHAHTHTQTHTDTHTHAGDSLRLFTFYVSLDKTQSWP